MMFDTSNKAIAVKQYLEAYENLMQKRVKLEKTLDWEIDIKQTVLSDDTNNREEFVDKLNEIADTYYG